jgi:hypothetical protein
MADTRYCPKEVYSYDRSLNTTLAQRTIRTSLFPSGWDVSFNVGQSVADLAACCDINGKV